MWSQKSLCNCHLPSISVGYTTDISLSIVTKYYIILMAERICAAIALTMEIWRKQVAPAFLWQLTVLATRKPLLPVLIESTFIVLHTHSTIIEACNTASVGTRSQSCFVPSPLVKSKLKEKQEELQTPLCIPEAVSGEQIEFSCERATSWTESCCHWSIGHAWKERSSTLSSRMGNYGRASVSVGSFCWSYWGMDANLVHQWLSQY